MLSTGVTLQLMQLTPPIPIFRSGIQLLMDTCLKEEWLLTQQNCSSLRCGHCGSYGLPSILIFSGGGRRRIISCYRLPVTKGMWLLCPLYLHTNIKGCNALMATTVQKLLIGARDTCGMCTDYVIEKKYYYSRKSNHSFLVVFLLNSWEGLVPGGTEGNLIAQLSDWDCR